MSEKKPELGSAAERRADSLRALEEELAGCKIQGKDERVKAIEAEIARVKKVGGRTAPPKEKAEA